MFTLAHLSDLHLPPPAAIGARAAASKRLFGYLSYRLKRKKVHEVAVLEALASDLRESAPDHIAITGDLTTVALPEEFARVRQWLLKLGPADAISVVPGNHDAYVAVPWSESFARWAEFMADPAAAMASEADFPFVRVRGEVAIVGVSSAWPSPMFQATGRIGDAQLSALAQRLERLGRQSLFRVVLVHHPPMADAVTHRKRLVDQEAFREVIGRSGAELILHGHHHRFSMAELATPTGSAPVVGVPSASACRRLGHEHASYHLYRLSPAGDGWRVAVEVRSLAESGDRFVIEHRFHLTILNVATDQRPNTTNSRRETSRSPTIGGPILDRSLSRSKTPL
jgi:3',5'-cyclic AMP phosphodiesterase CpdA